MTKWKEKELSAIAEVRAGSPAPQGAEYFDAHGIPFVRVQDVGRYGRTTCLTETKDRINQHAIDTFRPAFAKAGTILFPKSGAAINTNSRAILGINAYVVSHLAMITAKDSTVLSEWLYYWFCSFDLSSLSRTTSLPSVRLSDIKKLKIPVPEIAEQRRIVARIKECMERVEEIEGLRAEVVEEADSLAPSFYAAMGNGDQWPRMTVGELVKRTRNGRSIRQDNENATGYVLSLSAVHDVTLNLNERKPIPLPDELAVQYRISVDDVFVSRSNTRELVGLASAAIKAPERVIYPDLLIKLEPKRDLMRSRFLAYALRTPESRKQIKDRAVGTSQSMVKISGQRLKEVRIPVPPLKVQDSLLERFDELHEIAFNLMNDLRSFNSSALRQSILRKAFAGEL